MSTTPTIHYGWLKPVPGTEYQTWSPIVNTIFDQIDAEVYTAAGARIPRTLRSFNAVGDGTTDDKVAITAAMAANVRLTGEGLTYGVFGDLLPPDGFWLEDAGIKQLDRNNPFSRTLNKTSGGNITLKRVKIDRNGDGDNSVVPGDNAGIWFSNLTNILFEDVEVTGDGAGVGILLASCQRIKINRLNVHDIRWERPTVPSSELVGGINIKDCQFVSIIDPWIENMHGSVAGGPYRTHGGGDGLTIGGCSHVTVMGGNISRCGDGSDVSGSFTNENIWFYGTTYHECSAAQKWVHECNNSGSIGCRSYRAGIWGLIVGGTAASSTHPQGPRNIRISNFTSIDTGATALVPPTLPPIGINISSGSGGPHAQYNTILTDCVSIDTQVAECIISPGAPVTIVKADHGKFVGDRVYFTVGDSTVLPNGVDLNTMYYVRSVPTLDTFTISLTYPGSTVASTPYPNWVTATAYVNYDAVVSGGVTYICLVPHTSGVFATDLAANKWILNAEVHYCSTPTMEYSYRNESNLVTSAKWSNCYAFGARTDDWANPATVGIWNSPVNNPSEYALLRATGNATSSPTWERDIIVKKHFSTARDVMTCANGSNLAIPAVTNTLVTVTGPSGNFSIGGIEPTDTDGQHLYIYNPEFNCTILNNAVGAPAGWGILTNTAADVVLTGRSTMHLIYNGAYSRWILFSANP